MYRWLVWNILFRFHEWAKGHPTYQILREMEVADRLSTSELEQLCSARLREFIDYCYAHVPHIRRVMREIGVQPSQIRERGDLALLPVTTKADMRKHREGRRSNLAGKLTSFSTGGSTGEPLLFDLSKRRIASRVACRQRVSRWWGVSVGDREFALWGSPIELTRQDWLRGIRDRLLATQLLSAFEMNESTMSHYLDLLERGGCRQIFAYPSAIYLLCLHARKQGRNLRRLGIKVVFVTSELLFPFQRDLIVETFNCPVANGYGGRESGFIAHECPQQGMHVMADAVIVETVDSQGCPVPQGEAGEIVVTDLYSHEAPFLRYATGDIAVLSARRCACGRALPLLERIDGRANDSIVAPDGRVMHAQALIHLLGEIAGIEQFRIRQTKVDSFRIQIVQNEEYRRESEARIREGWTKRLRSPLQLTFEYVPRLLMEPSGKFRHVVSEVAMNSTIEGRGVSCLPASSSR